VSVGLFIVGLYLISIAHMHYRGSVRFPWSRQILTHTNYLSPYNLLMNGFSSLPNMPLLRADKIEGLSLLKENWQLMRDEALALNEEGQISRATGLNDAGFNSFFKTGWTRFYLKWYDDYLPSANDKCPQTVALLKQVPAVKAAMFAALPPGAWLTPHRDPFAGSLRYHLGLITPEHEDCFILVDGNKHVWRNGEDVLFDETFIHEAHNNTDQTRIILFADVRRPMRNRLIDGLNRFISDNLMKASATQNTESEKVGGLNRLFERVYSVRVLSRRIKKWNRSFYYALKYFLFFMAIYLLFLH